MDTCKRAYRKLGNQGLFDSEERTSMLSALGNPLERLAETVDFEMFRETLEAGLYRETLEAGLYRERLTNAGTKPYDYVLMFKILVLQRMYNLSDEQAEYQIVDRTSFRDFLGLSSGDKVPDARTIWAFREQLTRKALHDRLFADFDRCQEQADKEGGDYECGTARLRSGQAADRQRRQGAGAVCRQRICRKEREKRDAQIPDEEPRHRLRAESRQEHLDQSGLQRVPI